MASTELTEVADGIFRISNHLDGFGSPSGIGFCQFLVVAEQPMLVHTGMRPLFPEVASAVDRVVAVDTLRWLSFGHVEGDECGAVDELLEIAPACQVAFGALGCAVSVDDLARGRTRPLADGEVLDLGGRRVRHIPTPHVPHNWEAQVLYEEVTGTIFCGDLLGQAGRGPSITDDLDLVARSLATELWLTSTPAGPLAARTARALADLEPRTLAVMHGSSFGGNGGDALRLLASHWAATARLETPLTAG